MNSEFYISGKRYISAKRAAKLTGYATDYIGQLSRAGKLDSQMIGRSWFVSEDSLLGYKHHVIDSSIDLPRKGRQRARRASRTAPAAKSASKVLVSRHGRRVTLGDSLKSTSVPWNAIDSGIAFLPTVAQAASSAVRSISNAQQKIIPVLEGVRQRIESKAAPLAVRSSRYIRPEFLKTAGNIFLSSTVAIAALVLASSGPGVVRELPAAVDSAYAVIHDGVRNVGSFVAEKRSGADEFIAKSPKYVSAGISAVSNARVMKADSRGSMASAVSGFDVRALFNKAKYLVGTSVNLTSIDVYRGINSLFSKQRKFEAAPAKIATNTNTQTNSSAVSKQKNISAPAPDPQAAETDVSRGMVVVPSSGNEIKDREVSDFIQTSFSDEVEVVSEAEDGSSGVIRPLFRDSKGNDYLYVLVPVDG